VNGVLGGWQLQTILVLRSGTPYTPVISNDQATTGVGGQRPNYDSTKCTHGFVRSIKTWFNTGCYVKSASGTYGQVRANTLRSDVFREYDASIFKDFALPGKSVLSFRAEFFNVTNTTTLAAPNATVDATAGGQITATSNTPRQIQFALKYNF
jgi:hypothetical protein